MVRICDSKKTRGKGITVELKSFQPRVFGSEENGQGLEFFSLSRFTVYHGLSCFSSISTLTVAYRTYSRSVLPKDTGVCCEPCLSC